MALEREFKNFVQGSLNGSHNASTTTLSVNFDSNATIPSGLSTSNYMMMTIDPDGTEHAPEVVKATGISGSQNPYSLTVVRAQEGTSAQTWDADRTVVHSLTAGALDTFFQQTDDVVLDYTNGHFGIKEGANWAPAAGGGYDSGPVEAIHIHNTDPTIRLGNTSTGADNIISAVSAIGSVSLEADAWGEVSSGTTARVYLRAGGNERLRCHNTGVTVTGTLAKSSGSFDIEHPLLGNPHRLRHSFVEAPTADLIYRGHVTLDVTGTATVNIDEESGMTPGTWQALSHCPWSMVGCPGGTPLTWNLDGPDLTIEGPPSALAMWIVISERADGFMTSPECDHADAEGHFIVEYVRDEDDYHEPSIAELKPRP